LNSFVFSEKISFDQYDTVVGNHIKLCLHYHIAAFIYLGPLNSLCQKVVF